MLDCQYSNAEIVNYPCLSRDQKNAKILYDWLNPPKLFFTSLYTNIFCVPSNSFFQVRPQENILYAMFFVYRFQNDDHYQSQSQGLSYLF